MNFTFDSCHQQEQLNLLLEILASEGKQFPYDKIKIEDKNGVILMLMTEDNTYFDTDYFIHLINSYTLATVQWYADNRDRLDEEED